MRVATDEPDMLVQYCGSWVRPSLIDDPRLDAVIQIVHDVGNDSAPSSAQAVESGFEPSFGEWPRLQAVIVHGARHTTVHVNTGKLEDQERPVAWHNDDWAARNDSVYRSLARWLGGQDESRVAPRLFALAEELVQHLRAALSERDELLRRLTKALQSEEHARDRVAVLESQVEGLSKQLREANASLASGDESFIGQSKASLVSMVAIVVGLLGIAASVAQPFVADRLSDADTTALIEAQRETTAAVDALAEPGPIDLSLEVALRCLVVAPD